MHFGRTTQAPSAAEVGIAYAVDVVELEVLEHRNSI